MAESFGFPELKHRYIHKVNIMPFGNMTQCLLPKVG